MPSLADWWHHLRHTMTCRMGHGEELIAGCRFFLFFIIDIHSKRNNSIFNDVGNNTHQKISRFHVIVIGMNDRQDRGEFAHYPGHPYSISEVYVLVCTVYVTPFPHSTLMGNSFSSYADFLFVLYLNASYNFTYWYHFLGSLSSNVSMITSSLCTVKGWERRPREAKRPPSNYQ